MNLQTSYLGLRLRNPILPGASPLVDDLDMVRRLEDAGAAGLVMHSLFEEQLARDQWSAHLHEALHEDSFAEAGTLFPRHEDYQLGPERYLEQITRIKGAVGIPLIASLNGTRLGGWVDFARLIEQAGADALELNIHHLATDPGESGEEVEARTLEVLRAVRATVRLPIAVKLAPWFSSLAHFAHRLDAFGADALVLFNRFYQPDIDPEALETVPRLELSSPAELRLRLRWLAVLHGRLKASLACSGGVHGTLDVVKALMAGADVVQMVSALLHFGPAHLARVLEGLRKWMEEHEYESLAQLRGSMSLRRCPDPSAYERANYLKTLQLWKV